MSNEVVKLELPREVFDELQKYCNLSQYIKYVDVKDVDYSKSPQWAEAYKEFKKSYSKLKEIEFEIRNI